jgi:DegV family protein with EDD domain
VSNVKVVTDSTNCIPKALVREYGIEIVPVNMTINGKNYLDEVDITPAQFWTMLPSLDRLPTASGVGPGEFVHLFRRLAEQTDRVLVIGMSRAFSVTCSSAEKARSMVEKDLPGLKIEIMDSKSSMGALGFIVLEAAKAARSGKDLTEILDIAQSMVPRVKHYTGMHSLKYLTNIGRLPPGIMGTVAAADDSPLQLKTVISVDRNSGQIVFIGKYHGLRRAMEEMIKGAKQHLDPSKDAHFMVHYSIEEGEVEPLKKMVEANFKCSELFVTQCTAVMTCSTGPQFGISFYS